MMFFICFQHVDSSEGILGMSLFGESYPSVTTYVIYYNSRVERSLDSTPPFYIPTDPSSVCGLVTTHSRGM